MQTALQVRKNQKKRLLISHKKGLWKHNPFFGGLIGDNKNADKQ